MPVVPPAPPGLVIRPIGPGDEAAVDALLSGLDERARFTRWFTGAVDVARQVDWAAHPERTHAVGLLALIDGEVVGHGVLVPSGEREGEVAFEVAAPWRHHGVAGRLLAALCDAARERGMERLTAEVLAMNHDMLAVFREHGELSERRVDGSIGVEIALGPAPTAPAPAPPAPPAAAPADR